MRDTWKSAKVGLVVVVGLLLTYLVYRLVEERAGGEDGYVVWALFEDAQGLVPKSRVVIAGISVGYIDDIRLENGMARVDMHIDEGVPIHTDGWVTKEQASLLGEALLVINPGTIDEPLFEDGDQIPVRDSAPGTEDILRIVGEIAESVRAVTTQLERAFGSDEAGDQMESALRDLSEALAAVNRTIQQNEEVISGLLRDVEATTSVAGPQIIRILDNVESATSDVREILGQNREGLTEAGGDVTEAIASINRAAHQLEQVLDDVGEVTGRTARGEGTLGRLTQDETLIDEVEGVVEGVGDIVGGISRLQTIVELRSEYNFLANTFKNYVSLRIQPREDRYYLFQLINDPRGLTEFQTTTVRRSPPAEGEPAYYQETRVTTRDAFRFSLMFAKRIHFATFRFGILESTGGVGVDFHALSDELELTLDVFAFGEQTFPRLRARLAYEVVQRLWILGGIDDALNENSTDFFLGAQLRFNDEDLKSILPFASGATP
jgi:phospholipid/cholesterol/gamma-HCH transport system substrate-binding protein